MIIKVIKVINH